MACDVRQVAVLNAKLETGSVDDVEGNGLWHRCCAADRDQRVCMRNDDGYMSTHFVLLESLTARTPVDMDSL